MNQFLTEGLLGLPAFWVIVLTLIACHLTLAAVTIYLHRYQAHRSLELHPIVSHFMRFWLWLTTGTVTREWVAVHRKHHVSVETPLDPHSPQIYGINEVLLRGAELYRRAKGNPEMLQKYGQSTPSDWIETHLYTPHHLLGISCMLALDLALFGVLGLTVWALQMLTVPILAAGVINGFGHFWGYRNYAPADASTNILPWGILVVGEELHNNHHSFPNSAKLSSKWWEFDLGWAYIRGLEILGLAKVKRVAPTLVCAREKSTPDMVTLQALIAGRMVVMARYSRDVLARVCREQPTTKGDTAYTRMLRHFRKALHYDERYMPPALQPDFNQALSNNRELAFVYQKKCALQALLSRTNASANELLQPLQDWCAEAERSGIKALQDFTRRLKSYALVTAHPT